MRQILGRGPGGQQLGWAALLVAVAALGVALSGAAIGLPGKRVVDSNDLAKNVVKPKHVKNNKLGLADLSGRAERALTEPDAYALVLGAPELGVDERYSRGITDDDIGVNNTAFCIRGLDFEPTHVQVTLQSNPDDSVPKAILDEDSACQGETAVLFEGGLDYDEDFFVALYD
jgi:hypothetical protein